MKRTKLWKAFLLTAALTFGACGAVSAEEAQTVDITKVYSLLNSGTTAPAEDFEFTITAKDEAPQLQQAGAGVDTVTISYNNTDASYTATTAGTKQTVSLAFPINDSSVKVGEYVYEIEETSGSTAGVVYSDRKITVTVLVVNKADGTGLEIGSISYEVSEGKLQDGEGFQNQYKAVESLDITKNVTGSLGDKTKYFEVTVKLTGENGVTTPEKFAVSYEGEYVNPTEIVVGAETKFYLKDDETISIKNVPYGVTYTVVESDYTGDDGYDAAKYTVNGADVDAVNDEVDSSTESVEITNNKGVNINNGVILDNIPYLILIAVVIAAAIFLVLRRRTNADLD